MKETAEKIDVGTLGEQFGTVFRKLRPQVEESITKPEMKHLYENLKKSFTQEFGESLSKKDMLGLLTLYLVMDPVHQAIFGAVDGVD